jgi:hypothetical protein
MKRTIDCATADVAADERRTFMRTVRRCREHLTRVEPPEQKPTAFDFDLQQFTGGDA